MNLREPEGLMKVFSCWEHVKMFVMRVAEGVEAGGGRPLQV